MVRSKPCKPKSITQEILSQRERVDLAVRQKLAADVRAYREVHGLSIQVLADFAILSAMTVWRAEQGIAISVANRYKLNKVISSSEGVTLDRSNNTESMPRRPEC